MSTASGAHLQIFKIQGNPTPREVMQYPMRESKKCLNELLISSFRHFRILAGESDLSTANASMNIFIREHKTPPQPHRARFIWNTGFLMPCLLPGCGSFLLKRNCVSDISGSLLAADVKCLTGRNFYLIHLSNLILGTSSRHGFASNPDSWGVGRGRGSPLNSHIVMQGVSRQF